MPRAAATAEPEQLVLKFRTLEEVDKHARQVLAKHAEVVSAEEARIGRENELKATAAWEALDEAKKREKELRGELKELRKGLTEGVLNRLRKEPQRED